MITLLWLPSVLFSWNEQAGFFYWRHQLIMLSGILALSCMTVGMILAVRWRWVETLVHGLDKGYALHKQMGIASLILLIIHWGLAQLPKWLVQLGLLSRPLRMHRFSGSGQSWEGLARHVGEYLFYVFLIFAAISLIQAITYRQFRGIHKIGGLIFIVSVFHSVLLMGDNWSSVPMNIAIILMSGIGVLCAFISLTGNIGRHQKTLGRVIGIQQFDYHDISSSLIYFSAQLKNKIKYKAGQFAYIDFQDGEPPHPFSILNYDKEKQTVEFAIKDLGDYTHQLMHQLHENQEIIIEGGYGHFHIPKQTEQIWIGAGVGIVPFIAWLYWLSYNPQQQIETIHLFYCRKSESETFFEKIIHPLLSRLSNVEFHIVTSGTQGRLSIQTIEKTIRLSTGSVSFCGPEGFGDQLREQLVASGLPPSNFHREYFRMR
ncbi:ferredoxin reductase family protein [Vibrio mangrovi]|nr:ferric reductase-like transmembrane domain-containing protein [Vibrio mangrovi]MDW6003596.1 ferric reductase-like transmembrane domain-containing protein [Vibrio mangrovi]